MSARGSTRCGLATRLAPRQRGLSLIEMMVAILIALFLIAGVVVVEEGVNMAQMQQSGLSQLQDEERFATAMLRSVIGTAGYFPDPTSNSESTALPPATVAGLNLTSGQAMTAPDSAANPTIPQLTLDSIYVRYMTATGDGINLCDGTPAGDNTYTSYLYVDDGELYCQLETGSSMGTAVPLVTGVENMQIYYGVATGDDSNVVQYMNAADVTSNSYWSDVSSVKVALTFLNPLYGQPGQQQ